MINPKINYTIYAALAIFIMSSCDVHEWPEDDGATFPFVLDMQFNIALPLHKEVEYTRNTKENDINAENQYDIRYILNVYKVKDENDANREVWKTYSMTQPYSAGHDFSMQLQLPEGRYRFRVWSDHVLAGTTGDYFYKTTDFTEIMLDESGKHHGSNEYRDAFRGSSYKEVLDPELYFQRYGSVYENKTKVEMHRPMGRYEFISTDLDEFLDKAVENADEQTRESLLQAIYIAQSRGEETKGDIFWNGLTRDEVAEAIGIDKYRVVFSYNAFMPSSYNHYTDKPSDSSTGINYEGKMQVSAEGMQMGFDYVLVDDQTTMNMNVAVYDGNNELVASTTGIEVPVARSKNTIVKGAFLTVTSGGGVSINPDFEGPDFDIEIK